MDWRERRRLEAEARRFSVRPERFRPLPQHAHTARWNAAVGRYACADCGQLLAARELSTAMETTTK